jgi:hypothetical protein
MIGQLNAGGKADLCARKSDGVYCALGATSGTTISFGAPTKWSSNFANSIPFVYSGYETSESRYGSLRLVDVNGDGRADVCGREGGIECEINRTLEVPSVNAFGNLRQYTSSEYLDGFPVGWQTNGYGSTLQYGDIDGDTKLDVCGRGAEGIICMTQDGGNNFVDSHLWTTDFSDYESWDDYEYRYNSIRLVDLNADGKADICGRSSTGVKCGFSQGTTFGKAVEVMVANRFDSAAGYDVNQYGSELGFAKINNDGRPDVCVRGPAGIKCSYGY